MPSVAAFRPQRFIRPFVRPSDACVLRRRRLAVVDNTRSRANAVNTTLTTAAAARTRRWTDGRRSLKAASHREPRDQAAMIGLLIGLLAKCMDY
uniref:Uncharacterized protein n=1 Tax=Haemonchus contortus TaxID=6289 RepID=A0A7I4YB69_HAECO